MTDMKKQDLYMRDKGYVVRVTYNPTPNNMRVFKDKYFKTNSGADKFISKCKEKEWFTKKVDC